MIRIWKKWILIRNALQLGLGVAFISQHGEITYHDITENSENSWKFMKYSEKLGTIKHVP